jgi:glyoxylase-like metal-dependent hydrolase (beta-lactamase superfamily II)
MGVEMHASKLDNHIFLIDVETAGIKNFIASYVIKGNKTAIVETGPASSIPNLLSGLRELNVKFEEVAYVAVSHIHLDHGGGAGTLLKHLPNAKLVVHQRGAPHIANPQKLWEQSKLVLGSITELYGEPEPVPAERIIAATDGMSFSLGNDLALQVVETLGHASHHQSYLESREQGVFPGDAAGIYLPEIDVIVPTTPAPFRMDVALASINKLGALKPKALYYSHFGKALHAEEKLRAYTEQLNLWASIAREGLENKETRESIGRRIIEEDPALRKAKEYVKNHPILNETVLTNSVQGVVDFVNSSTAPG